MKNVLVQIYDKDGHLIKRFRPKSESDLQYHREMLDGVRVLDIRPQLERLVTSGEKQLTESHSLFCTFVKFGGTQQQKEDFSVVLKLK